MVGNGQPEVTSVGARHESSREGPERPRAHGFSGRFAIEPESLGPPHPRLS